MPPLRRCICTHHPRFGSRVKPWPWALGVAQPSRPARSRSAHASASASNKVRRHECQRRQLGAAAAWSAAFASEHSLQQRLRLGSRLRLATGDAMTHAQHKRGMLGPALHSRIQPSWEAFMVIARRYGGRDMAPRRSPLAAVAAIRHRGHCEVRLRVRLASDERCRARKKMHAHTHSVTWENTVWSLAKSESCRGRGWIRRAVDWDVGRGAEAAYSTGTDGGPGLCPVCPETLRTGPEPWHAPSLAIRACCHDWASLT